MTYEKIVNFDNREEKRSFLSKLGVLTGCWFITAKLHKARRSTKANAFYWSQVVTAMQAFLRNHGQYFEPEEVHEFLLAKFSSKPVIDPATGEVMHQVGQRSSKKDSLEFYEFVNHCMDWMWDRFGILVDEPDAEWRKKRAA